MSISPHSATALPSYELACAQKRKGSAARMWFLHFAGFRKHDRVGNVVERELINHEAKFRRQFHEREGLMVVASVGCASGHDVCAASVSALPSVVLGRLTRLRGIPIQVLLGGLHRGSANFLFACQMVVFGEGVVEKLKNGEE